MLSPAGLGYGGGLIWLGQIISLGLLELWLVRNATRLVHCIEMTMAIGIVVYVGKG